MQENFLYSESIILIIIVTVVILQLLGIIDEDPRHSIIYITLWVTVAINLIFPAYIKIEKIRAKKKDKPRYRQRHYSPICSCGRAAAEHHLSDRAYGDIS